MSTEYRSLDFIGAPFYRVGSDGYVSKLIGDGDKRPIRWKQFRGSRLCCGHLQVRFQHLNKAYYVHHLVLIAFRGSRPEKLECRHLNGDPGDNRLENLAWGTRRENMMDRAVHGVDNKGSRNGCSKLTESKVRRLRVRVKNGESFSALAADYGVSPRCIRDVVNRRTWQHV